MTKQDDKVRANQGLTAGLVMAGAGVLTIVAPWLVQILGLEPRVEFLFYLISMAAFIWALFLTWQIWQKNRKPKG
ncbi:DUF5337 domain-containing protein [Parasulfitobacter algicola]|uniref:DUF5337 domain-containing protein n=1 Tax=Parasulfitobacter algicola TaxID=2614809 RepID=A0ABX2IVX4_9RHOB|nr:DUF5337 domain-containing protein [Sulfitobacter algicola]NSX54519.1 DUF5337 domain-containing protein [Sulfitobacter algicola]